MPAHPVPPLWDSARGRRERGGRISAKLHSVTVHLDNLHMSLNKSVAYAMLPGKADRPNEDLCRIVLAKLSPTCRGPGASCTWP